MTAHLLKLLVALQLLVAFLAGSWLHGDQGWDLWAAAAGGVICGLALAWVVITIQFLIAARFTRPLPPEQIRGRPGMVRAWLRELIDAFMTFSVRQPFLGSEPLASASAPGREGLMPVLFVHGYFCNRAVWRPMARFLAQRGHVTGSVNLEPTFGSIDGYANLIEQGITELCQRTGHDQVALVCHSMGGLAARAYLRVHGDLAVSRVITLGTPHRGTRMAHLGFGENTRQMRFDSDWLADLAASESAWRRKLFTVILSHHDNIVVPQAIQVLPDAEIVEEVGIGHVSLVLDPAVHRLVAERLGDPARLAAAA